MAPFRAVSPDWYGRSDVTNAYGLWRSLLRDGEYAPRPSRAEHVRQTDEKLRQAGL